MRGHNPAPRAFAQSAGVVGSARLKGDSGSLGGPSLTARP